MYLLAWDALLRVYVPGYKVSLLVYLNSQPVVGRSSQKPLPPHRELGRPRSAARDTTRGLHVFFDSFAATASAAGVEESGHEDEVETVRIVAVHLETFG